MSTDTADNQSTSLLRVMGPKLLLLFIVGDILGTGVYALTGQVAAEVGGAAWVPFLVAFFVALLTAFSYLELVTKYPQAAGAALYVHKAFGIHFFTFIVAFAVMSSGITSASTASRAFASNLALGFGWEVGNTTIMLMALGFMALVMAINLRGVGESVKANVVLTTHRAHRPAHRDPGRHLRDRRRGRRLLPSRRLRHPRRQERLPRRHDRDVIGVLRDGRIRGLGQHGRGVQGPARHLPEDDAHRTRHHRPHLHPGLDLRGRAGASRRARRERHPTHPRGRARSPGHPHQGHLPVHLDGRRGELRVHQHDDGQPLALRHGQAGRHPSFDGEGEPDEPDAMDGDPVHHCALVRADRLRLERQSGRRCGARRNDRPPAARRVRDRQRRGADAAQGHRRARPLPHPHGDRRHRRGLVPLPRDAVVRTRRRAVPGGRAAASRRHRPVPADLPVPACPGRQGHHRQPRRHRLAVSRRRRPWSCRGLPRP